MTITMYFVRDVEFGEDFWALNPYDSEDGRQYSTAYTVRLPEGFELAENAYGERRIFKGDKAYDICSRYTAAGAGACCSQPALVGLDGFYPLSV